ncbi:ethanolamine utilization protein EutH [Klebsiella pneumoniae subsp. pneumoniae]|nr:ethanolamine utilization protein EutH [Klebsiella pneumoniae subsp. pneumoniae]
MSPFPSAVSPAVWWRCIPGWRSTARPVAFTFALILMNMIPVIIVAVLVALGLKFIPEK